MSSIACWIWLAAMLPRVRVSPQETRPRRAVVLLRQLDAGDADRAPRNATSPERRVEESESSCRHDPMKLAPAVPPCDYAIPRPAAIAPRIAEIVRHRQRLQPRDVVQNDARPVRLHPVRAQRGKCAR